MKAESLFKLEKYDQALPAYKTASTAAADDANVDETIKALILLHGGQSAGQLKKWQESLELLNPILTEFKQSPLVAEAQFEIGQAQKNLSKPAAALAAFEQAATCRGPWSAPGPALRWARCNSSPSSMRKRSNTFNA